MGGPGSGQSCNPSFHNAGEIVSYETALEPIKICCSRGERDYGNGRNVLGSRSFHLTHHSP